MKDKERKRLKRQRKLKERRLKKQQQVVTLELHPDAWQEEELARLFSESDRVVTLPDGTQSITFGPDEIEFDGEPLESVPDDPPGERRHLLDCNLDAVHEIMHKTTLVDPVVVVADLRDHHGRQFAIYYERTRDGSSSEEAERRTDEYIAECEGKGIPTISAVVSMSEAEMILPYTSPTATENLRRWKQRRRPGDHLVVVIAAGGNTYASVQLPPPARDGQNRCDARGLMRW